jgi:5-methylcytosine-specific restriction endonuclease McrBC GTP-binding regulatory subunit McrB
MSTKPRQVVFFGSPGTGKSYYVKNTLLPEKLGIDSGGENCIRTVFHPEYSYGDFMGKLMPLSRGGDVEYNYYDGHFLKALARAYKNIMEADEGETPDHVALVIDEINRGNSAAIFGTVFQLLDRESHKDGEVPKWWSEYPISVSNMEFEKLLREVGFEIDPNYDQNGNLRFTTYKWGDRSRRDEKINELLEPLHIRRNQIRIPSNLSLIATMNTSDNSIYHMDTAFKRRWNWQYFDNHSNQPRKEGIAFKSQQRWKEFVNCLNAFIRRNHRHVRKVEDKQIGHYFVTGGENGAIEKMQVQNKVMFFLWDSVFDSSREPLADCLDIPEEELVTFGDFAERVDEFTEAILNEST